MKQEIVPGDAKALRCIKAHTKEANVLVWPSLHAFERSLLAIRDVDGTVLFAKGLNFRERALIAADKSRGKVSYSLDMSSFDNSIRGGIYKGEIRAFTAMFGIEIFEDIFMEPLLQLSNNPADVMDDLPVRKSGDV